MSCACCLLTVSMNSFIRPSEGSHLASVSFSFYRRTTDSLVSWLASKAGHIHTLFVNRQEEAQHCIKQVLGNGVANSNPCAGQSAGHVSNATFCLSEAGLIGRSTGYHMAMCPLMTVRFRCCKGSPSHRLSCLIGSVWVRSGGR